MRKAEVGLLRVGRAAVVAVLAGTLGGCAVTDKVHGWFSTGPKPPQTATATAGRPNPAPAKPSPKPKPAARASRNEAPPERIASIDPNSLIGLDSPAVERLLGAPDQKKDGDPSQLWTYRGSGCAFLVYFFPDVKTGGLHALKFRGVDGNGAAMDASQQCIRNILAVKKNGTG